MQCPSCQFDNAAHARYCARCRMAFKPSHLAFARASFHLYWILRRACAGGVAGFIAWLFIPVITRILSAGGSGFFIYALTGFMGGAFLGSVDGMVEESTPKTIRGALLGGLGGLLGGLLFEALRGGADGGNILWLIFLYWAVAGGFIGSVSAWWERRRDKILWGIASGFFGGGAGAYIGSSLHAFLVQQFAPEGWATRRLSEAVLGAIIGLTTWFAIGTAERFVIFKRRPLEKQDQKLCDACKTKNELHSWYCGSCGSVLQEMAPAARLNLSPHRTLQQISEMLRFLSRLAAATGFIAGFVSLFIFIPNYLGMDQLVIVIVILLIALVSYAFQMLFSSLSEIVQVVIKK
jgi:MFS family permease